MLLVSIHEGCSSPPATLIDERRSVPLILAQRDPREAEEYLNAALEGDDPELFLVALRNVAEAQGGVAQLANKTKLNRGSLYKMLVTWKPRVEKSRCLIACAGVSPRRDCEPLGRET